MKTYKIIFSPTGGTAKVSDALTEKWEKTDIIDLSVNDTVYNQITLEENSLALIAMPSFGGAAPQLSLNRLACINANNSKCAIVAVYGNRAYENTLKQIQDHAEKAGFQVIAAVSAVAEHSIIHSIAAGRPDSNDIAELINFGEQIFAKAFSDSKPATIPGNKEYKKPGAAMVPKTGSSCIGCNTCARLCPAGAISLENPKITDKSACIGCMRCVSICPVNARSVSSIMTKIAHLAIRKECSFQKNNELFI